MKKETLYSICERICTEIRVKYSLSDLLISPTLDDQAANTQSEGQLAESV